jgi:plasmid stability protein
MQLTVRNVSRELKQRLEALSTSRGESINSTVLRILEQAVELNQRMVRLERYATWNEQDFEEFESALDEQRQVDEELWR